MSTPITFQSQFQTCSHEGLVGTDGPEVELRPAFPNKNLRDYYLKHGEWPVLNSCSCRRFGGQCSSAHVECRKLRGIDEISA